MKRSPVIGFFVSGTLAFAQNRGLVLLDRHDEHTSCVTAPADPLVETRCGDASGLDLGKTIRLLVLHRRFLTDYAFLTGAATSPENRRSHGGEIRPVRLGPSADSPVPARLGIPRKTSLDFLQQLVDPAAASEPKSEIEREREILYFTARNISAEIASFNRSYELVVGNPVVAGCDPATRRRDGYWLKACLHGEFDSDNSWTPAPSTAGEEVFRGVLDRAESYFADAQNFSAEIAAAGLLSRARSLEASIAAYNLDLESYAADLDAAKGASWIMQLFVDAGDPPFSLQLREQLRRQLALAGSLPGAPGPVLDEGETNALIDRYLALFKSSDSLPQSWRQSLDSTLLPPASLPGTAFAAELDEIRVRIHIQLPVLVSEINDWQERLAARLNFIYSNSEIPFSERDFDIGMTAPHGVVSYKVIRVSEYEPYVFTQSDGKAQPVANVEVSRGAFAVDDSSLPPAKSRTIWQLLRVKR